MQEIPAALREACDRFGDAVAIDGQGLSLTYRELFAEAKRFGAVASAAGLAQDEPVHVLVSNHPLDFAAFLGIWLAGGVVVPVHRTTPADVAARFLARTRARFQADGRVEGDFLTVIAPEPPPVRPLLDGAAFIIFTSGSTGEPKGAVIAHAAFHGKLEQIDDRLHFAVHERTLLVLNITFSFGLWLSLLTLLRGGVLVMREKFDASTFCETIVEERIDRVGMVPTMMRVLFSDPGLMPGIDGITERGRLGQIVIGGESLGRSLADTIRQRLSRSRLVDIYGLTETTTCDFYAFPEDYAKHPGCIGKVAAGIRFRIADDDRPCADGEVGELQIDTPYVMKGYLDAPELTAAAFIDRWFRTGDLARVVDGDVVELMGRRKEIISRGGNKVTPAEIEQAICAHRDVSAAMAVGVADPVLGERIHVLLVARSGVELDVAAVRQSLASSLERFKHPDRWYVADALPTGRTGKADRTQLGAMIKAGLIRPVT